MSEQVQYCQHHQRQSRHSDLPLRSLAPRRRWGAPVQWRHQCRCGRVVYVVRCVMTVVDGVLVALVVGRRLWLTAMWLTRRPVRCRRGRPPRRANTVTASTSMRWSWPPDNELPPPPTESPWRGRSQAVLGRRRQAAGCRWAVRRRTTQATPVSETVASVQRHAGRSALTLAVSTLTTTKNHDLQSQNFVNASRHTASHSQLSCLNAVSPISHPRCQQVPFDFTLIENVHSNKPL